jgi:hypothetical protein
MARLGRDQNVTRSDICRNRGLPSVCEMNRTESNIGAVVHPEDLGQGYIGAT